MAAAKNEVTNGSSNARTREYARTPDSIRRGELLKAWLDKHEYDAAEFSRDAKISKMSMSLYLRGDIDIANMHQQTVAKLLTAMHVSDSWAWEYFDIPEPRRMYWRTFREAPMGHGEEEPQEWITMTLDNPLSGEGFMIPPGAKITYDPRNKANDLLLVQLTGRYIIAFEDALPKQGNLLGRFISCAPARSE